MNRLFSLVSIAILIAILSISCQKEISYELNTPAKSAQGSLKNTSGDCLPVTVHGTFYKGIIPSTDTNYVEVQVQVDSTGAYNIFTNTGNGIYFSDSGNFNSAGLQTIKLKPHGTPQQTGSADYLINFDTTACGFTVLVKDSAGTGLSNQPPSDTVTPPSGGTSPISVGSWEFFDSTHGVQYSSSVFFGGTFANLFGPMLTLANADISNVFVSTISFPTGTTTVKTGTYSTTEGFNIFSYNGGGLDIESQLLSLRGDSEMKFYITGYNVSTKVIEGTFSGTARDVSGNLVYITKGRFKAVVTYA